jgi:hypothetical protein
MENYHQRACVKTVRPLFVYVMKLAIFHLPTIAGLRLSTLLCFLDSGKPAKNCGPILNCLQKRSQAHGIYMMLAAFYIILN